MSKITVKHYVNTELKAIGKLYPLYTQVIYKRKIYKFKATSTVFEYVNDELLTFLNKNGFLDNEITDIERTILDLEKLKIEISSKNIAKYSAPYFDFLDNNFKKLLEKEFKDPPAFLLTNSYFDIMNLIVYLEALSFYEISENVNLIVSISENMGARDGNNNDNLLCIDFFGGSKYENVLLYFREHNLEFRSENLIMEQLKIFKNFINI